MTRFEPVSLLQFPLLSRIDTPHDLKDLSFEDTERLAREIRDFIILNLSKTGGHLAPNLGVVEITLALHTCFEFPKDEICFDVGHQAYVHKLLTGRKERFHTLRTYDGLSGFTSQHESVYDFFNVGHGGTSISSAIGRAVARDLLGQNHHVIAMIGDGALTEGMALEALNHLGHKNTRILIILNDNGMSIAPNVGGYSKYLDRVRYEPHIRSSKEYFKHLVREIPQYGERLYSLMSKVKTSFKYLMTPGIIFEELGLKYMGPVDGHNLEELKSTFFEAKQLKNPVVIHVRTIKGKGFSVAEEISNSAAKWHGGGPFNPKTGEFIKAAETGPSYSKVFGDQLVRLAKKDDKICAITAAMPDGTGLCAFRDLYPERFYDVAMAEQHALTFASGLASCGFKPFAAIYSTFIQRGFDQIMHDICLQNLPVRICMDRGGIVGADGPTHHGVFDMAFLRCLPNLVLMTPRDDEQFIQMINTMANYDQGPIAIRYPRENAPGLVPQNLQATIEIGKGETLHEGSDLQILAVGTMVSHALELRELLKKSGIDTGVCDMKFVKPIDKELLLSICKKKIPMVTMEEGSLIGGFGSAVLETLQEEGCNPFVLRIGLPDIFIPHGEKEPILKDLGLDVPKLFEKITLWFKDIQKMGK